MGGEAGAFVEFSSGIMSVALEVNYVQKGFELESQSTDESGNVTGQLESQMRLQYLEIPLLVRASLPVDGAVVPYVTFGPSFGIALDAEFEAEPLPARDMTDDLQHVDVGGTVGVGARVGRGPLRLALEARYTTGFDDLWDISGNFESINQTFGFTAAIVY